MRPAATSRGFTLTWIHTTRLKVLACVVGLALAGLGIVSLTAIPAWPIVGAVVAAAAVVINSAAHRLSGPTCLGCGGDLSRLPDGEHGVVCPGCGILSFKPGQLSTRTGTPAPEARIDSDAA